MSKARAWAEATAAVPPLPNHRLTTIEGDGHFCRPDRSLALGGELCLDIGNGRLRLSVPEALAFARWILDTFGEPEQAAERGGGVKRRPASHRGPLVHAFITDPVDIEWITRAGRLVKRETVQSPEGCHADDDGECAWKWCPQRRDGQPTRSGRHCPLDRRER